MPLANDLQVIDNGTSRQRRTFQPVCTKTTRLAKLMASLVLVAATTSMVIITTMPDSADCIVVRSVKFTVPSRKNSDYALVGDTIELTSVYIMKDDDEDIKSVTWLKDGMNFARWSKFRPGIEVLDYIFKGHFDNSSTPDKLVIHNVTIDMHGKYSWSVKTDLGPAANEFDLIVIAQPACRMESWSISSQPEQCRETFKFDCRHMFPKPQHSCGLWNEQTQKFIRSVPIDVSDEPASVHTSKQTHRIRYSERFELDGLGPTNATAARTTSVRLNADLYRYAGHLVFKCDIFIHGTDWRLTKSHKMFHYSDGCEEDPLETIKRARDNYDSYTVKGILAAQRRSEGGFHAHRLISTDEDSFAHNFTVKLLLPSELRRLERRYRLPNADLEPDLSAYLETATAASGQQRDRLTTPAPGVDEDRNCWGKPRIGSLARLSCGADSVANFNKPLDGRARLPVKLTGSRLLRCTTSGWRLIKTESVPKDQNMFANNRGVAKQRARDQTLAKLSTSATVLPQSTTEREDTPATPATITMNIPRQQKTAAQDLDILSNSLINDDDDDGGGGGGGGARANRIYNILALYQQVKLMEDLSDLSASLPRCVALNEGRHFQFDNNKKLSNKIADQDTDGTKRLRLIEDVAGQPSTASDSGPNWGWHMVISSAAKPTVTDTNNIHPIILLTCACLHLLQLLAASLHMQTTINVAGHRLQIGR